ncbi:Double-stranded RNA-binding protein 2 [Turnera subulata]|uniref:Double-stranded RNA-binding protein 2 n=1 Tax=Turnera subulata TaxID=218843 RepID=A0A9Q0G4B5_9ROSI|nr:Double-stranded RNA-binding protein 2 [Turnera subulata]
MYKNQLQELAQRSCFNLPSYTCIREGPDHAPRFKATVNFNGEIFESPHYCSTLRQAEHSAAEVALVSLSNRGPSHSLAARILDETGVYKNLLQEIAQRVGAPLPQYTTFRSGLGHQPVFTGTVELAGITFTGEPAKNKKQAEKNAAMAAWSSLKQCESVWRAALMKVASHIPLVDVSDAWAIPNPWTIVKLLFCFQAALLAVRTNVAKEEANSSSEPENNDELEQITIARALSNYCMKEKMAMANSPNGQLPFPKKFPIQSPRPTSPQPHQPATTSRILPFICPKTAARTRTMPSTVNERPLPVRLTSTAASNDRAIGSRQPPMPELRGIRPQKFPAAGAVPYVPIRQFGSTCHSIAPPVTIRTAVPVFSAPPLPPPSALPPQVMRAQPIRMAQPVTIRQAVPVFAAPPAARKDPLPPQKDLGAQKDPPALHRDIPTLQKDAPPALQTDLLVLKKDPLFVQKDTVTIQKEAPINITKEEPQSIVAPAMLNETSAEVNFGRGRAIGNEVKPLMCGSYSVPICILERSVLLQRKENQNGKRTGYCDHRMSSPSLPLDCGMVDFPVIASKISNATLLVC